MPRVLLIVAHRRDRSPGQRYRFEQYLPYLEQHGFEFTLANLLDAADDRTFYGNGGAAGKAWVLIKGAARRLRDVTRARQHDAILLFREAYPLGSTWFERGLHRSGVPMIFDFDDAIWLDSTSDANRRFAWLKNGQKTNALIAMSQIVTAGNEYLATYARRFNGNVRIVPTTIDTSYYTPAPRNGRRRCRNLAGRSSAWLDRKSDHHRALPDGDSGADGREAAATAPGGVHGHGQSELSRHGTSTSSRCPGAARPKSRISPVRHRHHAAPGRRMDPRTSAAPRVCNTWRSRFRP